MALILPRLNAEEISARQKSSMDHSELKRRRVLVAHECLPHFDRSGADLRLMQVLQSLARNQCEITFIARNGQNAPSYRAPLEKMGITVYANDVEHLRFLGFEGVPAWTLPDVVQRGVFDVVVLCLWFWSRISVPEQYLREIRRCSPQLPIIVLTDDRHGERERRMAQLTHSMADEERARDYEQREIEILRQADLVAAISEDDRQGLLRLAPELEIGLWPMVAEVHSAANRESGDGKQNGGKPTNEDRTDKDQTNEDQTNEDQTNEDQTNGPWFSGRKDFLLLANFENTANREALEWLLREIWPEIRRKLPGANLSLAGTGIPGQLQDVAGIRILGHVPDLPECFGQHRVFLSPVRFGTGIKTKNLMALAHGLPVVTTTVGAEGLNVSSGKELLIADGAKQFASRAIQLYEDPALWMRLRERGPAHVLSEFSAARLDHEVLAMLRRTEEHPAKQMAPDFCFSIMRVEEQYPEALTHLPPAERIFIRMLKHMELADAFLRSGRPEQALEQLRHTFALFPTSLPGGTFFEQVFQKMADCRRSIGKGNPHGNARGWAKHSSKNKNHFARAAKQNIATRNASLHNASPNNARPHNLLSSGAEVGISPAGNTLALAMIVRNAAQDLSICLKSARHIVNEIVIVDTGSTDSTREVAAHFGAQVISEPWRQDFSAARNASIAAVECGWVIVLDADEELDQKAARALPSLLRGKDADGYRVPLRHYVRDLNLRGWNTRAVANDSTLARTRQYPAYVVQEIVRLFRHSPDIFFEGRVHEMVDRSILRRGGKIKDANFCIHHYGHARSQISLLEKNKLYLELGRMKAAEMPDDAHAHLELGLQEMDNFQNYGEALKCFDRACLLDPANHDAWLFAGMAALRSGHPVEAMQRLRHVPGHGRSAALVAETLGEAHFILQDFASAAKYYNRAAQLSAANPFLESKAGFCELRAGRVAPGLRKMNQALNRVPESVELYDRLIAAYVSLGRLSEAAESAERRIAKAGPTPEAFMRAASIRAQLREWPQASTLLQEGLAKFPQAEKLKLALTEVASASASASSASTSTPSLSSSSPPAI